MHVKYNIKIVYICIYRLNKIRWNRIIQISDSLLDKKREFLIIQEGILTQDMIFYLYVRKIIPSHSWQTDVTDPYAEAAAFNATDFYSHRWKLALNQPLLEWR
jgi:hypothetical protein